MNHILLPFDSLDHSPIEHLWEILENFLTLEESLSMSIEAVLQICGGLIPFSGILGVFTEDLWPFYRC